MPLIRVRAVSGKLPFVDAQGRVVRRRRAVGASDDGTPLPDGELVPDHAYYRRAIRAGTLELVPEPIAPAPTVSGEAAPTPPAVPETTPAAPAADEATSTPSAPEASASGGTTDLSPSTEKEGTQ